MDKIVIFVYFPTLEKHIQVLICILSVLEKASFLTVSVWWSCRHVQDVSAEHQHRYKNKYWFNLRHLQIGLLWRDGTWCECECAVWLLLFCCVVSDWSKMLSAPQRNVYRTRNLSENHIFNLLPSPCKHTNNCALTASLSKNYTQVWMLLV